MFHLDRVPESGTQRPASLLISSSELACRFAAAPALPFVAPKLGRLNIMTLRKLVMRCASGASDRA
jgi:hypothetical protein